MTTLLTSPFLSADMNPFSAETATAVDAASPDTAVARPIPEAGPCGFEFDPPSNDGGHQGAPAAEEWNPDAAGATNCIGEIFAGARKLNQLPGIFDPEAITGRDELLYVTLKLSDEPGTRDLPCIPDEEAFMAAIEPLPLFLRRATG
jgi:hypothetical protein